MQSLICEQPGTFAYHNGEEPTLLPGNALLRIRRIGICGTDLHAYQGTQPFFSYPRVLGHELAAELVDPNGAEGFVAGEIVSFIPYFNCGNCIACRNEKPNCCTNIKVCGVHVDGGMVEYLQVPNTSLLKSEGLDFDALALVEPLAIGAHGVRRAAVKPGEFVLVIGAGPIGLGTMEFARIAGAKVIALDINDNRLAFCKERLKVDQVINPATEDAFARLQEITGGDMATVVIDATGSQKAINNALQFVAHGGRFVLIGLQKETISFSHPEFHKRETTLMSSRNATREDFEHVISSMKQGLVDPTTYITHRVKFSELKDAFPAWLDPASGVIKAIVELD
ncbi:MAG: zinc-binding alcohol dehydrogenase family protein [Ferruginibacter sp.]|nr:zinc-binding alcohol dehydrogenase family protein [Ferruginibacter sp.]